MYTLFVAIIYLLLICPFSTSLLTFPLLHICVLSIGLLAVQARLSLLLLDFSLDFSQIAFVITHNKLRMIFVYFSKHFCFISC